VLLHLLAGDILTADTADTELVAQLRHPPKLLSVSTERQQPVHSISTSNVWRTTLNCFKNAMLLWL
jgi:hypothetical protein